MIPAGSDALALTRPRAPDTTEPDDIGDALKLDDTEDAVLEARRRRGRRRRFESRVKPNHRIYLTDYFAPHPTPARAAPDADRISLQVGEGPLTDPDLDGDARQLSGANGK
jgi:hypothetical protein